MNKTTPTLVSLTTIACLGACSLPAADPVDGRAAKVLAEYTLPPFHMTNFGYSAESVAQAEANGPTRVSLPAIASGLQRLAGNHYVSITDRGPTFTRTTPTPGRVFPLSSYTPSLVFFQVYRGEIIPQEIIPIVVDDLGTPATGISNSGTEDSVPFASPSAPIQLPFNPNGLDLEDVHTLPGGKFIAVDEYSPSVVIIDENGKVLKRYTPHGKTLNGAAYPVSDILPGILAQRRSNRGFESVVVSRDGRTAYTLTQSPLGPTSSGSATRNSRILRVLKLDISDPLNMQVTGQFVVRMSQAAGYPAGNRQQDLKVSAAAWLSDSQLLLLERSDEANIGGAKLVLVDFSAATDISGISAAQSLALEDASLDLATLGITPAASTIVFGNEETPELTDFKLEGLSILNANEVALSNDNDFGIGDNLTGTPSRLWVIRLREALPTQP